VLAIAAGADVVRVHDVAPVVRAVRVADAILRLRDVPPSRSEPDVPGQVATRGIQAQGRHGVGDDERGRPQPFEVDVALRVDLSQAAATDRLEDTVDYAALQTLVTTQVQEESFHLIESLAASIGESVLERWPIVTEAEVAIRKPEALLPGPASAEVRLRIRRGR
jgi:dihydroneopterin aldolase